MRNGACCGGWLCPMCGCEADLLITQGAPLFHLEDKNEETFENDYDPSSSLTTANDHAYANIAS